MQVEYLKNGCWKLNVCTQTNNSEFDNEEAHRRAKTFARGRVRSGSHIIADYAHGRDLDEIRLAYALPEDIP